MGGEQHTENSAMASLFPSLLSFHTLLRPARPALSVVAGRGSSISTRFLVLFPPLALPSLLSGCPSSSAQQLVLLRFPLFFFIPPPPPLLLLSLLLPPPSFLLRLPLDLPSLPSSFTGRIPAAKRRRKWLPRRRRQPRRRSC